jgi:hypothetical protein
VKSAHAPWISGRYDTLFAKSLAFLSGGKVPEIFDLPGRPLAGVELFEGFAVPSSREAPEIAHPSREPLGNRRSEQGTPGR